MANTFKKGIDYFSHDTSMRNDIKIKLLIAKYGLHGYAVYNLLLEEIYSLGYYLKLSDDFILLFSTGVRLESEQLSEMISFCIEKDLFDKELYDKYNILTSGRIQANYLEATKKRKHFNRINSDFNLIDSVINPINAGINLQKKRKKTKLNEIKEEERVFFSDVLFKWNVFAELNKLQKILKLTTERENSLLERLTEPEFNFKEILERAKKSKWLLKEKTPPLNLDYIISGNSNYIKILEGKFDGKKNEETGSSIQGNRNNGKYTGRKAGQSPQEIKSANRI